MADETEIKFLVSDLPVLRARVLAAGGVLIAPRVLEVNLRFENATNGLRPAGQVLRLRRDTRARLTYKGPSAALGQVQTRPEFETEVADFNATRAILEGLGYHLSWAYEKYRETFHLGAVEVVLDELPFGNFLELEGPDESSLRATADLLGLDWWQRYLGGYSTLFAIVREKLGLTFRDLTFDNFAGIAVPPSVLGL